jgi:hypothetical protein
VRLNQFQVGDDCLYHSEPPFPELIVPYGIQHLTHSPYNHISTVIKVVGNDVWVIEAIASGYKIRHIKDSITPNDKYVSVFRWRADRQPMTDKQKAAIVFSAYKYENAPYAYSQIVELAALCNVNDTSLESYILRVSLNLAQNAIEEEVKRYAATQNDLVAQFFRSLGDTNKGMLTCSEGAYLLKTENGMPVAILNEEAKRTYYKQATGDILEKYRNIPKDALLDPVLPNFITPGDMATSPDEVYIDDVEVTW